MVCKEDVLIWFKELESYKRIDTMCSLLNMCLPFELRFLGTCLEELGTRDSKELRGIELRVNNSSELAAEIAASQLGEPSDIKARRKMALYLALIRACNRPCVNELFSTLYAWGNNEFLKTAGGDALQELLLVYTMASNHPVFSFEQRMRCGEVYQRILFGLTDSLFPDDAERIPTASPPAAAVPPPAQPPARQLASPVDAVQNVAMQSPHQYVASQPAGVAFEQNLGSQLVHREIVSISPHHVYVENAPPVYQQNVTFQSTQICPNPSTSNVVAYTMPRQNMVHPRYPAHLSDVRNPHRSGPSVQ